MHKYALDSSKLGEMESAKKATLSYITGTWWSAERHTDRLTAGNIRTSVTDPAASMHPQTDD